MLFQHIQQAARIAAGAVVKGQIYGLGGGLHYVRYGDGFNGDGAGHAGFPALFVRHGVGERIGARYIGDHFPLYPDIFRKRMACFVCGPAARIFKGKGRRQRHLRLSQQLQYRPRTGSGRRNGSIRGGGGRGNRGCCLRGGQSLSCSGLCLTAAGQQQQKQPYAP